jgi:type II secretory pathway pseudopilin PulG
MSRVKDTAGLTLIELLIVVVMMGAILLVALPSFSTFRERMRLDAAAYELVGDLQLAQIEAIKRNQSLQVTLLGLTQYRIDSIGTRTLTDGVEFYLAPALVRFASFGPPVTGPATYTLKLGSRQKSVIVNASGLARVQ